MSVSFSERMYRPDADKCFEEFVEILNDPGGNVEDVEDVEDGLRTLKLDGTTIGLPVKNPFAGGVRFKILEPNGANKKTMVVLDSECMDAINEVLKNGLRGAGTVVSLEGIRSDFFSSKYDAYQKYKKAAGWTGEGEIDRGAERLAAFTLTELAKLIEFLQQRFKVNISPTSTIFNTESR
jgi:hypothetical protein